MHPNPIYHTADTAKNLAFARARAFGTLCVATPEGPLVSHVPFLLAEDGSYAELHLVRSNPIARALTHPRQATLAVNGADSYISPDWYNLENQVPTWNYVAVHLKGQLSLKPQETMRDLLDRQSAEYEARLPKAPWTLDKVDPEALNKLLRMIVPCKLGIGGVDGTWKFSQNKPEASRLAAADHAAQDGFGAEVALLARMMRDA